MSGPRFSFVPVMDHELHVTEWGDPGAKPLVLWHGLARTGRDFDELASALSDEYFVLCPDTIGRGLSSWSDNPEAEYSIEYYSGVAADLLDHYGVDHVRWLGTSMGGLIGMRIASGPMADRLSCLILNDVGPEIPQAAIDRILAYADASQRFASLTEAEIWFRTAYAPFGQAGDAFWRRLTRSSVRRMPDGSFTTHYDPRITVQFSASAGELDAWERYERIALPVHVLRGAQSDILLAEISARMGQSGPRPGETVFDCGHAPSLSRPEDAATVRGLLAKLAG